MPLNYRVLAKAVAALSAVSIVAACGSGPPPPPSMTLTFVRHAESAANATNLIDTSVPGPAITAEGSQQARTAADKLRGKDFDGIYASPMVRTQQTAAPLAADLGERVQVLPGLREIGAGRFEGAPAAEAAATYFLAPMGWLQGNRDDRIPESVNGNEFNDQFTAAVQKIYDSGDRNAVAFSHSAAVMVWTLMNVRNPNNNLLASHPLPNTGEVVIRGNPITGWTLLDWDGVAQAG